MKKIFTFVLTMLLGASLAFAQNTGGSTSTDTKASKADKKTTKTTKAHKADKKNKKNTSTATQPK
jgi:hypothetical protein